MFFLEIQVVLEDRLNFDVVLVIQSSLKIIEAVLNFEVVLEIWTRIASSKMKIDDIVK